ncbi:enoyl-CoA hydratase-related protein [Cesiribacter sp. SM1]|uniref:enoyl-CoA hydratase-related protein n=1 Tax=Cesiribacter sp. SM1 TaxID=2861196 RepID=UPI001CD5A4BD|nr:enoyl-CoA hydratase-related protein [Cesiribacter sp. SM1]
MYQFLKYEKEQGVVRLSMNRPEVYNAFNNELTYELQDAFKQIRRDDEVRVVVLTGEGKAFGSGQDLKASQADPDRSFLDSVRKRYNPLIKSMRELPKPIICRLNGVAAGAGCSLALACDIIVASEQATLIEVFINIGLVPDSGSSYFIPRLVSPARAFELCTMGNKISARQAYEWGMINKVVPHDQLDSAVQEYVNYYAAAPTKAIGMIKKMLNKSQTASLDEMLEYEAYCQEIAGNSADHKEGVSAFLEKRKPQYQGK